MKITKRQLRKTILEAMRGPGAEMAAAAAESGARGMAQAHPRGDLGQNIADVDFPIIVGYEGKSEIAYNQDELDDILDYLAPTHGAHSGIAYSLDSLHDKEAEDVLWASLSERQSVKGRKVLKEYSDYPSWLDLSDQLDDIADTLDMAADKYVTSAWLFSGDNEGNVIANSVAEKLEQLYRDAETLAGLIQGSGVLK